MKKFYGETQTFSTAPKWAMTLLMLAILAGCGGNDNSANTPAGAGGGSGSGSGNGGGTGTGADTAGSICGGAGCVNIGTAANYVILAKTGVSTVPNSVITGNIGLSPAATSYLTGWSLIPEPTNTFDTSAQVAAPGQLYAADMVGGTTSADLGAAVLDMQAAYTEAAGMAPAGGALVYAACPGAGAMSDVNDALASGGSFNVTGIGAGVYTCPVNVTIPGTLTLNGSATDVWVFQIAGTLTEASAVNVNLTGGALPQNVFWQASGGVTIGTTALLQGVILSQTAIAVQTGATVNGRLLAQSAVTLEQATVTAP
jgi:hypothetical protein